MTVTTTHHHGLYSVADVDTDNCRHSSYSCLKSVKRMHGELVRCNVKSHQTSLHVHKKFVPSMWTSRRSSMVIFLPKWTLQVLMRNLQQTLVLYTVNSP